MQEFDFQTGLYQAYQKSDYVTWAQVVRKVEKTPHLNTFKVWDLKKRDAQ